MSTEPLKLPDQFHLDAAEGWLGLGNVSEARAELAQIAPELWSTHPVLMVRWQVHAAAREWDEALEVAATLIRVAPEHPFGWIHRSYALHETKRTAEARDNLLPVVDKFPDDWLMRYNLACYECQLGRFESAKTWLQKALSLGDVGKIKSLALEDPDLNPLWKEIADIQPAPRP